MYISKKELETIREIEALVRSLMEDCGGIADDDESKRVTEYWQDFYDRVYNLRQKAVNSYNNQQNNIKVQKLKKKILKGYEQQNKDTQK